MKVRNNVVYWSLLAVVLWSAVQVVDSYSSSPSSLSPTASLPLLNASSVYLNATNTANFTISSTSQVIASTPAPVDDCLGKTFWRDSAVDITCGTTACATTTFNLLSKFMTCNKAETTKDLLEIAAKVTEYAAKVAASFTNNLPSTMLGNGSISFVTDKFLVEAGYMNKEKSDLREWTVVPNFAQGAASAYSGKKDLIKISKLILDPGVSKYFTISFKDILSTSASMDFKTPKQVTVTELEDIGAYSTPARTGHWVVNSQIVHIGFDPVPKTLTDYTEITFLHKKLSQRKNHACVHLSAIYGNPFAKWSTGPCHNLYSDRFKTVCRCNSIGGFALVSQVEEKAPPEKGFSRSFFSQIASAISGFIILGLICCLINPLLAGCFQLESVRITFFHDVAFFMLYAFFLVGVMVSENLSYADTVASCINYFQTAVISWLLVEGIHNYHSINAVYDPEVTSPIFFYSTIGWGIPAAFSGACAGYPYKLEKVSEFSWMKVSGSDTGYFVAGPLFSFLGILLVYALIFYELSSWIGSRQDCLYRRAREYINRSFLMLLLAMLTWYSGIMARNRPTGVGYHYLFLSFFSVQGAVIIYLHLLKNSEISEYRAAKKSDAYAAMSEKTEEDLMSIQSSMRFSKFEIRQGASSVKNEKHEDLNNAEIEEEREDHLVAIEEHQKEEERTNSSNSDSSSDEEDFKDEDSRDENREEESGEEEDFREENDLREEAFREEDFREDFREEVFGEENFREESSKEEDFMEECPSDDVGNDKHGEEDDMEDYDKVNQDPMEDGSDNSGKEESNMEKEDTEGELREDQDNDTLQRTTEEDEVVNEGMEEDSNAKDSLEEGEMIADDLN